MNENLKIKTEGIARLISKLSEQEQAKIYYMLKGFEIFGNPSERCVSKEQNLERSN